MPHEDPDTGDKALAVAGWVWFYALASLIIGAVLKAVAPKGEE